MKSTLKALMLVLAAVPFLTSAQWDSEAVCRNLPPSPGECVILSYTGVGLVINPGGIETELGDQAAILLGDGCVVSDGKDWEPQNPGFYVSFTLPSGNLIEATNICLGPDCIGEVFPTINGITTDFIVNSGICSMVVELGRIWYRQSNFCCAV